MIVANNKYLLEIFLLCMIFFYCSQISLPCNDNSERKLCINWVHKVEKTISFCQTRSHMYMICSYIEAFYIWAFDILQVLIKAESKGDTLQLIYKYLWYHPHLCIVFSFGRCGSRREHIEGAHVPPFPFSFLHSLPDIKYIEQILTLYNKAVT